jgi:hypothetical protein
MTPRDELQDRRDFQESQDLRCNEGTALRWDTVVVLLVVILQSQLHLALPWQHFYCTLLPLYLFTLLLLPFCRSRSALARCSLRVFLLKEQLREQLQQFPLLLLPLLAVVHACSRERVVY